MSEIPMQKVPMRFNGNEIVFINDEHRGIAGIAPDQPDELAEEMVRRWNMHTEGLGMYGETPRVQVGQFSICRQDDSSVWIEKEGGEGFQAPDALFEAAVSSFFDKHM